MTDYTRPGRLEFTARGVDVNTPVDRLAERGKFPLLLNVVVNTDGSVEPRAGLVDRFSGGGGYGPIVNKTPVHSARRLNDSSSGTRLWSVLYGVGDTLALERSAAPGTLTAVNSGYSGNPLAISIYRPPRSTQPWLYVGDSTKMRKVSEAGTVHSIGLPAPTFEPRVIVDSGAFKTVDLFETSPGGWVASATGTVAGLTPGKRVNTTITAVLYEVGSIGGVTLIRPAAIAGINVDCVIGVTYSGPTVTTILVTQVNRPTAALAIATNGILYDSGSTGLCSVVLTVSPPEITVDSMLFNSTRSEYARVRSCNLGPNESRSYRISTTSTWVAGDTVTAVASFVCHTFEGAFFAAADVLVSEALRFTVTGPGTSTVTYTRTVALDLTSIPTTSTTSAPSSLDDFLCIALRFDSPQFITEVKVLLDCDAATNDFTQNYFYRAISSSDLTAVTQGTQSVLDNRRTQVERRVLDVYGGRPRKLPFDPQNPGNQEGGGPLGYNQDAGQFDAPAANDITDQGASGVLGGGNGGINSQTARNQAAAGANQWSQISFRLQDMQRIGNDESRGFANIAAIRIEVVATSGLLFDADSWILRGGYAPDVVDVESGYQYAYRARVSSTGTVSDISPLSRGPAYASRQAVYVGLQQYTAVAEVDYLDVFRIGGALEVPSYIGTVANSASPFFSDTISDNAAFARSTASGTFDPDDPDIQPWPIIGLPVSGTTTVVSGTTIGSSAAFPASLLPGTSLLVGGIPTLLYRVISTSRYEVDTNLGALGTVRWEINEPVIPSQPLPVLFGPFHDHLLACGDDRNPGSFYYTKAKQVDSTSRRRRVEVTDNSDPLLNGFVFNGRAGIFSSQCLYYIEYNPSDPFGPFSAQESPNVQGLYAKWAIAVSRRRGVAWLASDGVYIMEGGGAKNLTDRDLRPLFPYAGRQGVATNGIAAPYMPNPVGAEEVYLRLAFDENDNLRFVYRNSSGSLFCLLYDFTLEGWFPLIYTKPVTFFYAEEGRGVRNLITGSSESPTGHIYNVGGASDDGTDAGSSISCRVRTPSMDFGDPRSQKQFGDVEVDLDPGNATITVTPGFDNYATTVVPTTLAGSGRTNPPTLIDLSTGSGQFARNIALDFAWTNGANQRPRLYLWEPSYIPHPEDLLRRATDYDAMGTTAKYVRGVWIEADTASVARTVVLEYTGDDGVVNTFTIPGVTHPVKSTIYYPISTPFYALNTRLHPSDAAKWKLYGYRLDQDAAPPYSTEPSAWVDGGEIGMKFLQGVVIDCDTKNSSVSFEIRGDNNVLLYTIPAITANIRSQIAVPLLPAVRTHVMRLIPLSPARVFGVRWDYQHDSEIVTYYEGQETSFDLPGYKHVRELFVAYAGASSPLTLTLYADGVAIAGIPALPVSASYVRYRILIPATKCKAIKAVLSSAATFRLYSKDCSIYYKGWGENGEFHIGELFGTQHRDRGVAVQ